MMGFVALPTSLRFSPSMFPLNYYLGSLLLTFFWKLELAFFTREVQDELKLIPEHPTASGFPVSSEQHINPGVKK